MKYMLVYQPSSASVFAVSRLACSPERRVTSLVFHGNHDEARMEAEDILAKRRSVGTAHCDRDGDVSSAFWRWGTGAPDRVAVESRQKDRRDVTESNREAIEARTAGSPVTRGAAFRSDCRILPRDYKKYLQSERWTEKRRIAIRRAGGRCQVCNGRERINVHHRTYERLGDEAPGDIIVLCCGCHKIFHDNGRLAE